MISKIILAVLVLKLLGKLGLKTKLRDLKPRFDRAVNITLVVLCVAYAAQLIWLFSKPGAAH